MVGAGVRDQSAVATQGPTLAAPWHAAPGACDADAMSDTLIHLLNIAEPADVDLVSAANAKLTAAGREYPADDFAGRAPARS